MTLRAGTGADLVGDVHGLADHAAHRAVDVVTRHHREAQPGLGALVLEVPDPAVDRLAGPEGVLGPGRDLRGGSAQRHCDRDADPVAVRLTRGLVERGDDEIGALADGQQRRRLFEGTEHRVRVGSRAEQVVELRLGARRPRSRVSLHRASSCPSPRSAAGRGPVGRPEVTAGRRVETGHPKGVVSPGRRLSGLVPGRGSSARSSRRSAAPAGADGGIAPLGWELHVHSDPPPSTPPDAMPDAVPEAPTDRRRSGADRGSLPPARPGADPPAALEGTADLLDVPATDEGPAGVPRRSRPHQSRRRRGGGLALPQPRHRPGRPGPGRLRGVHEGRDALRPASCATTC